MHAHISARSCNFTFSRLKILVIEKKVYESCDTESSHLAPIFLTSYIAREAGKLVIVWCQSVVSLEVVRTFLRQRRERVSIM